MPERKLIKRYFAYGTLLYIQFFFVYGSTNWLASENSNLYSFYFAWEQYVPFTPAFIMPYLSLSLFIILPVLFLDVEKVVPWAKSYMLMVFIAGFIFLVIPTEHAMTRLEYDGDFKIFFSFLYAFDLPYNLFPSLHVSLSTLALLIMLPLINYRWVYFGIAVWWLSMTIAVILVYQHHVSDVIGGILLAWICYRYIYFKAVNML